jgi:TetR/AcrR family tetracycline transcriptional repressor
VALTREAIARAGLRLLNEVGLNGLTLRLIGDELGVKAPALYWHVKNKQELLDDVATQMYLTHIRQLPPPGEGDDWAERLAERARALRRMMLAYRDGAKVFSGTYFTDDVLPRDTTIEEIVAAGYPPEQAGRVLSTVYNFVTGFTIEQQAVEPMPNERDKRYDDAIEQHRERGGALAEAVAAAFLGDFDKQFEEGLKIVLLGAKAWLS